MLLTVVFPLGRQPGVLLKMLRQWKLRGQHVNAVTAPTLTSLGPNSLVMEFGWITYSIDRVLSKMACQVSFLTFP